jgi:hypothetical protein
MSTVAATECCEPPNHYVWALAAWPDWPYVQLIRYCIGTGATSKEYCTMRADGRERESQSYIRK